MKRFYVATISKDVDRRTYTVLRRIIHAQFDWAYVEAIGIQEEADLCVSRHDDRQLTIDDRTSLKMFVAGARAALARVLWRLDESDLKPL